MEELKIGDRVTVITADILKDRIGTSGVVSKIDGYPYVTFDSDGRTEAFGASKLKKEEQKMSFKVGQKVTVVGQQYEYMNSIGKTGVITKVKPEDKRPYQVENNWWYNADELKEANGMTKGELKVGSLVQLRQGEWAIVSNMSYSYDSAVVTLDTAFYTPTEEYKEDLAHNCDPDRDIMKIAEVEYFGDIVRAIRSSKPIEKLHGFKVLWQRENPKKQQLTELVDKLQKQLRDATEELEAM